MLQVRIRRLLLWVVLPALVLVLLYTVLGFYFVPRLVRSGVHDFVSKNYHREVVFGDIRFNPYTLRLDIRDFSLPDADGKPMLAFQHLLVDLTVASVWHLGPDFEAILLEQPFARVLIKSDGTLNFADLALPPSPGAKPTRPDARPARLFIKHFSVVGGNVAFEDLAHPSPFRTEIKPITFDLRDFATVGKDVGKYSLAGSSDAGERFSWTGSLDTYPLTSRGQFEVANLQAKTIWNYLRDSVHFELPSGTISIAGEYDFTAATSPVGLGVTVHDITVTDLGVRPKGAPDDYIKLTRLEVHETRADVAKRTVDVGSVRLAGAELRAWVPGAGGTAVNLMELVGPTPVASGITPAATESAGNAGSGAQAASTAGAPPGAAGGATGAGDGGTTGGGGTASARSAARAASTAGASRGPAGDATAPGGAGTTGGGGTASARSAARAASATGTPRGAAGDGNAPGGAGTTGGGDTASARSAAGAQTAGVSPPVPGAATADSAAWVVSVPDIAIDGVRIAGEDRQISPAVPVQLDDLSIHVTGFTTSHSTPVAVVMSTKINQGGKLDAKADLTPDLSGIKGKAALANLDLTVLQPYIGKRTAMTLRSGLLSAKLNIERAGDGMVVGGEVNVAKLRTIDNELKRDFIKVDDLEITGIDYRAPPPSPARPASLHIKDITARAPYARVIIESDRSVNVGRVLGGPNGAKEASARTSGAGVADAVANVAPGSPDTGEAHAAISIGKVPPPAGASSTAKVDAPAARPSDASATATADAPAARPSDASATATADASAARPADAPAAATADASAARPADAPAAATAENARPAGRDATTTAASSKHSKRQGIKSTPGRGPARDDSMAITIDAINLQDGSANYADLWIQPHFALGIQGLNGSILGLSSNPRSHAKVELKGKVDRYAPVHIWGETNPLAATSYSDIKMSFKGVELTSATPYSGHFAGYKIDKGKLSVDIDYKIENRQLTAAHKFVIDQLELGERVESPDAVHLPLKIAVALLKDRNGVIDIDLPVTGSLDDPQFRIGPLIWKAVLNLLTKIATAPFAMLGRLFGGGEQMNYIDFHPGSAVLDPSEHDKLVALVKALKEKEKLELDVPVTFSPDVDRPGLAAAHLNQRLLALSQDKASGGHKRRTAGHTNTTASNEGSIAGGPAASPMGGSAAPTSAAGSPNAAQTGGPAASAMSGSAAANTSGPRPTEGTIAGGPAAPTGGPTASAAPAIGGSAAPTSTAGGPVGSTPTSTSAGAAETNTFVVGMQEAPHSPLSAIMDVPPATDPALTDPVQRYQLLVALFRADMGKSSALPEQAQAIENAGKKKDQPPPDYGAANAELEAALMQKSPVPDRELEVLGKHRARAIEDVLLIGTELDPARVFVIGSAPKGPAEKDKVRVELALK